MLVDADPVVYDSYAHLTRYPSLWKMPEATQRWGSTQWHLEAASTPGQAGGQCLGCRLGTSEAKQRAFQNLLADSSQDTNTHNPEKYGPMATSV